MWEDAIKGRIECPNEKLEDLVLLRSDGRPTVPTSPQHLDDADAGITHVIRGEDYVPNTPKQIQILEALDRPVPVYAHVPNVSWDGRESCPSDTEPFRGGVPCRGATSPRRS